MSLVERGEFERRLLAEHKERRARFFAPPKPDNAVDQKVVEIAPMVVRSPYEDVMDLMVAAVGNAAGLPVNEIIEGPAITDVITARRLAIGLSVVRCEITVGIVAKHFGVLPEIVRDCAKELHPLWRLYTLSSKTPIERVLSNLWPVWVAERECVKGPSIRDIQDEVCKAFETSRNDMLSHCRTRKLVDPRHIAMGLCKYLTHHSLPEIGRKFGDRDHTSALHAYRRVESLLDKASENFTPRHHISEWVREIKRLYDLKGAI